MGAGRNAGPTSRTNIYRPSPLKRLFLSRRGGVEPQNGRRGAVFLMEGVSWCDTFRFFKNVRFPALDKNFSGRRTGGYFYWDGTVQSIDLYVSKVLSLE